MRRSLPARALALLATVCLPLLLCGCLDYQEVITLNQEGGGTVQAEFTLDMGPLSQLSLALGEALEPGDLAGPSRSEVQAMLSVEGVTLQEFEYEQRGTQTHVRLRLDFSDLQALHRIEGFSAQRGLELYDAGGGKTLLVSRFDPQEVIPLPGLPERFAAEGDPLEPLQAAELEALVAEIRRTIRLKSELRLPGPVVASNGDADAAQPGDERSAWLLDGARDSERQASLGRHEVLMKVLCDASTLPWAQGLEAATPELGSVTDDALSGPTLVVPSSTSPALTSVAPSAPEGRSGGCSLALTSGAGAGVLAWLLLGCALLCGRGLAKLPSLRLVPRAA